MDNVIQSGCKLARSYFTSHQVALPPAIDIYAIEKLKSSLIQSATGVDSGSYKHRLQLLQAMLDNAAWIW